jgi:hypothetical protein
MNLQEFANKHNVKMKCFKMPGKEWGAVATVCLAKHGEKLIDTPTGLGQTVIDALNNLSKKLSNSMIFMDIQNKEYPSKIDQFAFNVPQLDMIAADQEIDSILNTFGDAIEASADNNCICVDSDKLKCPACNMRKELTWWLRSQAPGISLHPDAVEDTE